MSKIKNGGLDQYGAEPFEQQQFETAGAEWVKLQHIVRWSYQARERRAARTADQIGRSVHQFHYYS